MNKLSIVNSQFSGDSSGSSNTFQNLAKKIAEITEEPKNKTAPKKFSAIINKPKVQVEEKKIRAFETTEEFLNLKKVKSLLAQRIDPQLVCDSYLKSAPLDDVSKCSYEVEAGLLEAELPDVDENASDEDIPEDL